MAILTLLTLAVALALDAFAVAMATGMQLRCINLAQTTRMAGAFGFFQFAMPVVGWFLGSSAHIYIARYDHWVAFALLAFVGGRMLREAWNMRCLNFAEVCAVCPDPTTGTRLLFLAVATSIDALAVGISIAMLGEAIWIPAIVIGMVCAVLTTFGIHLGRAMCAFAGNCGKYVTVLGGLALVGIGLNVLHSHGVFG